MMITVSKNYILSLRDQRLLSSMSTKIMRYILNSDPVDYKGLRMRSATAKELSEQLGISHATLINKHWQISSELTAFRKLTVFESVAYSKGRYTFYYGPSAEKFISSSGLHIQYDSENLKALGTMYPLCLYEMAKEALLTDPRPTVVLSMADMSEEARGQDINNYFKRFKAAAEQVSQSTDVLIEVKGHPTTKTIELIIRNNIKPEEDNQ